MKSNILSRIIASIVAVLLWGVANFAFNTASPLISSQTSVEQLKDSNAGYVTAKIGASFNATGLPSIILLIVLAIIWFKPLKNLVSGKDDTFALLLIGIIGFGFTMPVFGYYNKIDDVEYVMIRANQTAFLVPMQGRNREGQALFDSAAFLNTAKVGEKRIQIPHQILPKKGMLTSDMYIPSSVLYIVTREPYVRMWVKEATRGTSKNNDGFFLETSEGINVDFGVSIGARIEITNAATYLFYFGVENVNNPNDEYPSVINARALTTIMDSVVHQRVQTLLAAEFGKRTLDECIHEKAKMMEAVEQKVKEEYARMGITIEYLGYASQLNFATEIQTAIDKVFVAKKEALAAKDQMEAMPARVALAEIKIREGYAEAVKKWDGKLTLPNIVVVPGDFMRQLGNLMNGGDQTPLVNPKK